MTDDRDGDVTADRDGGVTDIGDAPDESDDQRDDQTDDQPDDRDLREAAERRRRRDAIFGDELPERAPPARGEERERDADILRDVPPHHG